MAHIVRQTYRAPVCSVGGVQIVPHIRVLPLGRDVKSGRSDAQIPSSGIPMRSTALSHGLMSIRRTKNVNFRALPDASFYDSYSTRHHAKGISASGTIFPMRFSRYKHMYFELRQPDDGRRPKQKGRYSQTESVTARRLTRLSVLAPSPPSSHEIP